MTEDELNKRFYELREVISISFESLEDRITDFSIKLEECKNLFLPIEFIQALDRCKITFIDFNDNIIKSMKTLNLMINELKGVVSMSRAGINSAKEFASDHRFRELFSMLEHLEENIRKTAFHVAKLTKKKKTKRTKK